MGYHGTRFRNHIIILGWDDFAHSVTRQLLNADRKVAIVTNRKEEIDLIQEEMGTQAVFVLFADLKNIGLFDRLNIEQSAMIFINIAGDAEKLVATLNLRKAYPDSRFLVTLESRDLTDTFHAAGVSYVISKNEIASKITASYIFEPDAADFANDLLSSTRSDTHYDFQQFQVTQENPYLNRRYVEAFDELKREHNILLTGLCKVREGRRNLIKLPEDEVPIELGDYLIMIVNGRTEKIAEKIFKVAEGVV